MKNKIIEMAKPFLLAVFYPTLPLKSIFMGLAVRILKIMSSDRDTTATTSFEFYFNKILFAKQKQQKLEFEIKIEELGKILGFANTASTFVSVLIFMMYFFLIFLIPALAYFVFKSFVGINLILAMSTGMSMYYSLLIVFLAFKNWGDLPNQDNLKLYILKDFSYIYAKSMEIDEEVATLAMNTIVKSVLLDKKQTFALAQKNLNQSLGL